MSNTPSSNNKGGRKRDRLLAPLKDLFRSRSRSRSPLQEADTGTATIVKESSAAVIKNPDQGDSAVVDPQVFVNIEGPETSASVEGGARVVSPEHKSAEEAPCDLQNVVAAVQGADTVGHGKPAIANQPGEEAASDGVTNIIPHSSGKGTIAKTTVKEVLKVIVRVSDSVLALKAVASSLLEIFERYDAVNDNQLEFQDLKDRLEKLADMVISYDRSSSVEVGKRLDGLSRALGTKIKELDAKLARSLVERVIFTTEDAVYITQVVRFITSLIEITVMDMTMQSHSKIHEVFNEVILAKLGNVVGARFNHEDRPSCMPGTRVLLLADLLTWATDKQSPHVFWLSGMAGTGKTTAAESFCIILNQNEMLGASFFCSNKASDRSNIRNVFPSLAKALASMNPSFKMELSQRLEDLDPLGMNIADQFQKLILEPAELTLEKDKTLVLAIDALDECDDRQAVKILLNVILKSKPSHMLRFFVTSRPESAIRNTFSQKKDAHLVLRLHDIESHIVQEDIALYLQAQLDDIPGLNVKPSDIDTLVQRAGSLFIYASTICQYIGDPRWDASDRFQKLCNLEGSRKEAGKIYDLYTFILTEAFLYCWLLALL